MNATLLIQVWLQNSLDSLLVFFAAAREADDAICKEAFHTAGRDLALRVMAVLPSADKVRKCNCEYLSSGSIFHEEKLASYFSRTF